MEYSEFLGVYTERADAPITLIPGINESGLWKAWSTVNGGFAVQPLDLARQPWGELCLMSPEAFCATMEPFLEEDQAPCGVRLVRSNSPDLLLIWYEQERNASAGHGGQTGGVSSNETALSGGIANLNFEEFADPLEHSGAEGSVPYDSGQIFQSGGSDHLSVELIEPEPLPLRDNRPLGAVRSGIEDAALRMTEPETGPGSAGRAGEPASITEVEEEANEERTAIQESSMRYEFSVLMEQLGYRPTDQVEKDIEKLLEKGYGFSWRQKYMFSEFGMALRRKKMARLALKAHSRAMALAPDDGHVLFNMARSEYEVGNVEDSRFYLNKALTILPDFLPARNFLDFLSGRH